MSRLLVIGMGLCALNVFAARDLKLVTSPARTKQERNLITSTGVALDEVRSNSVRFLASPDELRRLKELGVPITVSSLPQPSRNFPIEDAAFHDYEEVHAELEQLAKENPEVAQVITIGKSLEGRELWGIRISSSKQKDSLPTAIFMGCHHAREHLSVEIPLKLASHLVTHSRSDARIQELLANSEVWIVPMVNPDGAEFDIASKDYQWWRKNRAKNDGESRGVDLNRNYGGKGWGGPGSSGVASSDIYHGPSAFSEPETLAVRDFVRARKRATVLLTFHTFSELVLWPWGHTDDEIENVEDRRVFETMGKKMATWNHYTPEKSSDLYLASGDTTDWAYDELKIFAFTFELSPNSLFAGGFYPGAKAIEPTFQANLEPTLYLIEHAPNPYAVNHSVTDPLGIIR